MILAYLKTTIFVPYRVCVFKSWRMYIEYVSKGFLLIIRIKVVVKSYSCETPYSLQKIQNYFFFLISSHLDYISPLQQPPWSRIQRFCTCRLSTNSSNILVVSLLLCFHKCHHLILFSTNKVMRPGLLTTLSCTDIIYTQFESSSEITN